MRVNLEELCENIKKYDFNLRLSVNLNTLNYLGEKSVKEYFDRARNLGADQLTFRVLYTSGMGTPQDQWIKVHTIENDSVESIRKYIVQFGEFLEYLPYGQARYSVDGLSTVLDDDCMAKKTEENLKYLILQPDCHLYSKWDDKASLVF